MTGEPQERLSALDPTQRPLRRLEFLAEAGRVLVSSLDYEVTLDSVAHLAVPGLADYCTVFITGQEQPARRISLAHRNPDIERQLLGLFQRYVSGPQNPKSMVSRVLSTGESVVLRRVPSEFAVDMYAHAPEIVEVVRQVKPVSAMSLPLTVRGRLLGAINFAVTEPRRAYSDEDIALARELAHIAALAIEHARLYEEQQRAIRTRDDVLSVVSHDLRTPLNAIAVSASVLETLWPRDVGVSGSEPDQQTVQRQLGVIRRAVRGMGRLIDDLLDAARLEAETFTVEAVPVDLTRVISRTLDMLEAQASFAGISISWTGERALPLVLGDEDRLGQVLSNLLENAIKFTEAGSSVRIHTRRDEKRVQFEIEDFGVGIPLERLERLFDRFWHEARADAGRSGAGLGLWIARGIVEAHGGKIWARSTVGTGSCFYFTLPRVDGAPTPARRAAP